MEIKTSKEDMMKMLMVLNTHSSEVWQWLRKNHPKVAKELIEGIPNNQPKTLALMNSL